MALMATDTGGGDFKPAPAGTHRAVCYGVVDMGMQESQYGAKHKVRLSWELSDEETDDGKPLSVHKTYTLSLNEKANLRTDLEGWRNRTFTAQELKGFDLFTIVGKPCLVTVTHRTSDDGKKTYANVTSVSGLLKGMEKPAMVNDPLLYSPDDAQHNDASVLPEWMQEKIGVAPAKSEREAQDRMAEVVTTDGMDDFEDEVPF